VSGRRAVPRPLCHRFDHSIHGLLENPRAESVLAISPSDTNRELQSSRVDSGLSFGQLLGRRLCPVFRDFGRNIGATSQNGSYRQHQIAGVQILVARFRIQMLPNFPLTEGSNEMEVKTHQFDTGGMSSSFHDFSKKA
jgi:hypothetical protein